MYKIEMLYAIYKNTKLKLNYYETTTTTATTTTTIRAT